MATSLADPLTDGISPLILPMDDPFVSSPPEATTPRESHRYSSFDTQLFSLSTASPSHAKRVLEAHLVETERRLQEASKLGATLIQQQKELTDKLKEIERQQDEGEIGPELHQKLVELEKEYNETSRESARALLAPKRLIGAEDGTFVDLRSPASPSVFLSQATGSPTKVGVPSRRQRNQPASRVYDIEFATEISTSLLAQLRQLHPLLAEREEALKTVSLETSRLELEAEGYHQRIRALDESEQRYKDENWSLETQAHDLMAAAREAADRETRLNSTLSTLATEKSTIEREMEELKQAHSKLQEEQVAAQKAHDTETHTLRRNLSSGDSERVALQVKVEELASQNQELAKAVTALRSRFQEMEVPRDISGGVADNVPDQSTPENSPPPSPNKQTPRHGHLETETLRSSLGHAHRMIQNLKSNIHREKTEKIELKRVLQEARDELELRRREPLQAPSSNPKRQKIKPDTFKKPTVRSDLLGHGRRGKAEVTLDEPDWEDHISDTSPTRLEAPRSFKSRSPRPSTDQSDVYQTATENEDPFETANERETATESEAFQTVTENMPDDSSDELTETEDRVGSQGHTLRGKRMPSVLLRAKAGDRSSFTSTASTSADEAEEMQTPVQTYPPRYRLKMNRSGLRRSRPSGEASMTSTSESSDVHDSPAGFAPREPAAPMEKSLFSELEELGSQTSEVEFGTPLRSHGSVRESTPHLTATSDDRGSFEMSIQPIPKSAMVDSSTMTDHWEPPMVNRILLSPHKPTLERPAEPASIPASSVDSFTQYTPTKSLGEHLLSFPTPPKTIWDESAAFTEKQSSSEQSKLPSPEPPKLAVSSIFFEETVPIPSILPELELLHHLSQSTEPAPLRLLESKVPSVTAEPETGKGPLLQLSLSPVYTEETSPLVPQVSVLPLAGEPTSRKGLLPQLSVSPVYSEQTIPVASCSSTIPTQPVARLSLSGIQAAKTIPVKPTRAIIVPRISVDALSDSERPPTAVHIEDNSVTRSSWRATADYIPPLNCIPTDEAIRNGDDVGSPERADQAVQTTLLSQQIDQILMDRAAAEQASPSDVRPFSRDYRPSSPGTAPRPKPQSMIQPFIPTLQPTPKRPGSASSQRLNSNGPPPLPADHKQIIAAAQGSQSTPGAMGPPLAPASVYKTGVKPWTPNDQLTQNNTVKDSTMRPKGKPASQISRRSSLSSFVSELDERFNIRPDGTTAGDTRPRTDPRMIQAITQTMIGEYLWKYTRKTVSGEMSNTRHRRYFWVHPYTRTLYWSEHDPQAAGKSELKAKSVPIEAVRVITDDNPYPPGLHRKSLEVVTPSRRIRFTASTSQRHETWFNALSYLLLRTSGDEPEDQDNLTSEDLDEFNPSFYNHSYHINPRVSLSSFNSRASRNTSKTRATSAMSIRPAVTPGRASPSLSTQQSSTLRASDPARHSSASRLSTVISATIRSSFSSRRDRHAHVEGAIYDSSVANHDSAEDLRQAIERQEREADRLENVRACCDGKHDVTSLPRTSRYSAGINRASNHHHT